jgi:hypothetical protein
MSRRRRGAYVCEYGGEIFSQIPYCDDAHYANQRDQQAVFYGSVPRRVPEKISHPFHLCASKFLIFVSQLPVWVENRFSILTPNPYLPHHLAGKLWNLTVWASGFPYLFVKLIIEL